MRAIVSAAVAALLVTGCGGSSLSMSEYGDRLEEIRTTYAPRAESAWTEFLELADPTPQDVKTLSDHEVAVRVEIEAALRELDVPEEVSNLHELLADWTDDMRSAGAALGERAGVSGTWDELLSSAEYRAFEETLIGGAALCNEFQAELDATAARGAFADTPWIPGDLEDVADAVIGCETIPEDLDAIFRR